MKNTTEQAAPRHGEGHPGNPFWVARWKFRKAASSVSSYEKAAAAGVFFNFLLSMAATVFAVKAVNEIRSKQRETYTQMATLGVDLP